MCLTNFKAAVPHTVSATYCGFNILTHVLISRTCIYDSRFLFKCSMISEHLQALWPGSNTNFTKFYEQVNSCLLCKAKWDNPSLWAKLFRLTLLAKHRVFSLLQKILSYAFLKLLILCILRHSLSFKLLNCPINFKQLSVYGTVSWKSGGLFMAIKLSICVSFYRIKS